MRGGRGQRGRHRAGKDALKPNQASHSEPSARRGYEPSGGPGAAPAAGSGIGRIAAIGALVLVVIAVAWILLGGGDDGNKYSLVFETGGQLVEDNQVLIGGAAGRHRRLDRAHRERPGRGRDHRRPRAARGHHRGDPLDLALRDRQPLHLDHPGARQRAGARRGRRSSPRSTPPPRSTSTSSSTPSARPSARASRTSSRDRRRPTPGRGEEANETYRYLSPALAATDRLFQELNRDQQVLTDFLVNGVPGRHRGRRAPRRPRRPGLQREPGPRRDRLPERAPRPRPASPCRRRCARRTPPSSTCG